MTDVSTVTGLLFGGVVTAQFVRASAKMARHAALTVGDKVWRYFQNRNAADPGEYQQPEGDPHGGPAPEHG
ncbi:hypothetical protein [Nocardia beijingensis]